MANFEVRDQFYLDGKPFQIISGGIHYFRVVPEYWEDRLQKLKALGCNTVETYVPWNMHEPKQNTFDFSGMLDLVHFIKLAASVGLYAIVRPSPYICAEWEFGGLPAWLLTKQDVTLRSSEGAFLTHVRRYYETLLPMLAPLQVHRGGNIIMMQVENEYGYYGDDSAYLQALRDRMVELGIDVPLITSDGPQADTLAGGSIAGVLPTGNFGSKAEERFETLAKYTDGKPLMCTEFWIGWFDHWGCGKHHTTMVEDAAKELRTLLERGHMNIYMFHGGTNFGFMNGANYYEALTPDVTSYDYDALLTEDGRTTPKYEAFQQVIRDFLPKGRVLPQLPKPIERKAYGPVKANATVSLFDVLAFLPAPEHSLHPQSMEALGQSYGYTLYRTPMRIDRKIEKFRLWKANDRAQVYFDRKHALTLYDRELVQEVEVAWQQPATATMDVLVENMGRVNFGVRMREQHKGIAGDVLINGHFHTGWEQYTLPMTADMLKQIPFANSKPNEDAPEEPTFSRFELVVDVPADTFLDMTGWGKGCVIINGFNIGRFWAIGPQKRLYVPAPLLKTGSNECIIFETEGKQTGQITFCDEPDLG